MLRPAELAEARLIQTYAGYITMIGGLGLSTGIVTFLPREADKVVRMHWVRTLLLVAVGFTALVSLGGAGLSWTGALMTNPRTAYWFRWFLFSATANVAVGLLTSYYQAERHVKKLAGVQSFVRALNVLLILGITWVMGFPGYVIALALAAWMYAISLYKATAWEQCPGNALPWPRGIWGTSLLALFGNGVYTLGRSLDLVFMDRLVSDRATMGCFALASSFLMLPQILSSTIQSVGTPYFAAHHADRAWLSCAAARTQAIALLASIVAALGMYAGCWVLVRWLYGPAYMPTLALVVPLLIAYILSSTYHVLSIALLAGGFMRTNVSVAVIMLLVSVFMSYVCIRAAGVRGAVWAQVVNAFLYATLQHAVGWRRLIKP